MSYKNSDLLQVKMNHYGKKYSVGRLALISRQIYFEYDKDFIQQGLEISPFKLPLKATAQICEDKLFGGLFGVFNDSLPDGWGRLLLDRQVEKLTLHRSQLTPLDRLAHVGRAGMGALYYEPVISHYEKFDNDIQLDKIAQESQLVLAGEQGEVFEELLALNGSSSGARPKIVAGVSKDKKSIIHGLNKLEDNYSHWIIKFSTSTDPDDIGAIEYAYSRMAKAAGIEMPETYLFKSHLNNRYFGIKRFDRQGNQPVHMHSLCGLIHADHRTPSLDYNMLLKVTQVLTKNMLEVEKVFRLACFNVLAHNRDDHSKNFSYILNETNQWQFSPAYDLTFSQGPAGEQSMLVMGEGLRPDSSHLLKLGKSFGLKKTQEIILQVKKSVSHWKEFAQQAGVSKKSMDDIWKKLK